MARVTDIFRSGNNLVITWSDCSETIIDLCTDCDGEPSDNPGDWPPPVTGSEARCRVAIHLGAEAATRLIDFFSGLNLTTGANIWEAYAVNRISVYGWPITLYNDVLGFEYSLYSNNPPIDPDPGRGLDAQNEYDANPSGVTANVQKDLYCCLSDTGEFTEAVRNLWIGLLQARGTAFYAVLADFLGVWPLDELREIAFNASTNTDEIDCSGFDCDEDTGICASFDISWAGQGATPAGWASLPSNVSVVGWLGDTTQLTMSNGDYSCSRGINQNWFNTRVVGGSVVNQHCGIKYVFDEPCLVTVIGWNFNQSTPAGKRLAIAVKRDDDVMEVLINEVDGAPAPTLKTQNWTGTRMVKEVWFMGSHAGTTGTASISVSRINPT